VNARLLRVAAIGAGAALAVTLGCELALARDVASRSAEHAPTPARRVVVTTAAVRSHVTAAPALAPVRLSATGAHVLVLDAAHRRLATWQGEVSHVGPVLGRRPLQLAPDGDVLGVFDPHDARITIVHADGRVRQRIGLAHLPATYGACAFGDGTWLLLTADSTALWRIGPRGEVRWRRPLPWPQVTAWPELARQGLLLPTPQGCVVAMAFGPGWATIDREGRLTTAIPYRETAPSPRRRRVRGGEVLASKAPLVADATRHGDTLDLLVAGRTADAWRMLDRYHVRTGAYLGSVRLPGPVRAIAAEPLGWVAIVPTPRGPRLARLVPEAGPAPRPPSVGNLGRTR
jgi:hypothetical protein